jgi:hypothetical protein
MKFLGFALLYSGWLIVVAALALLQGGTSRVVFVLAGVAVEALGLGLAIRGHLAPAREAR